MVPPKDNDSPPHAVGYILDKTFHNVPFITF